MNRHRRPGRILRATAALAVLALAACGSQPKKGAPGADAAVTGGGAHAAPVAGSCPQGVSPYAPAQEDPSTRGDYVAGGLYKPGVPDRTPDYVPNVDCIPEPVVADEPRSRVGNRSPYSVLGKHYKVLERPHGYVEQGTASYYGSKFHGRRTSNQEVYDMYAFTAAHKTLPLPSFARVTNLDSGKSVVVRVNDRGPFHEGRVIDLSYAAAVKLGIIARGTGRVEVRALVPDEDDGVRLADGGPGAAPATQARSAPTAASTPARTASAAAAKAPAPATATATATALDHLVQALPADPAAPAPPGAGTAPSSPATSTPAPRVPAPAPVAVATHAARPASPSVVGEPLPVPSAGSGPLLQVASFSSADNARRALQRLLAAGISEARLEDVTRGGRTLWRLRVPAAGDPAELAVRIAGLGFGTPQPVRD